MPPTEQGSHYLSHITPKFIGRRDNIALFVDHVLRPVSPALRIMAISGNAGVGKTTLLYQLLGVAQSPDFKDYCLVALVDEQQVTPADAMKEFADQFSRSGYRLKKFEQEWSRYKDTARQQQEQRENTRKDLANEAAKMIGLAAQQVPVVGMVLKPFAEDGANMAMSFITKKYEEHLHEKDFDLVNEPVGDLTRTFIADLTAIMRPQHTLLWQQVKPQRIILFFDTFGRLAPTIAPWLLRYLLPYVDAHVGLVLAGRAPIEDSIPDGSKRLQPYRDNGALLSTRLENFNEEETHLYLQMQSITEQAKMRSFWQVSQGQPYYLYLLTTQNSQGNIDPQADVVENFLRRIPPEDTIKRKLTLEAALFTKPFNQDDLAALPLPAGPDTATLYDWLIAQPLVQQQGGPHYDEHIQALFCLYLKKRSPSEYNDVRRLLVEHYEKQLQERVGTDAYASEDWLPVVLALVAELLLLQAPSEEYHCKAIEYIIQAYVHTNRTWQTVNMVNTLKSLSLDRPNNPADTSARLIAQKLLICIRADLQSQEFIEANSYLLERAAQAPFFPREVLAAIYRMRGQAYTALHEYTQAVDDFNHSIALNAQDAIEFASRGFAYRLSRDYQHAIEDFDQALVINPNYNWVFAQRALAYRHLGQFEQAIQDLNSYIASHRRSAWAFGQRGNIHSMLKNYPEAIADLTEAINIDNHDSWAYAQRGLTHLWMRDLASAMQDYVSCHQKAAKENTYGWIPPWIALCEQQSNMQAIQQLETLANTQQPKYIALLSQGMALWLHGDNKQALTQLEQALTLEPDSWGIHFWKGMACASSSKDDVAVEEIKQALAHGLPPILLSPLHRFEQSKPEFYQQYVVPLLSTAS